MPLDFQKRKIYYNRCNPNESLAPNDERNLDIDAWGPNPVRGINWAEHLAARLELADKPVFEMFTGLPGSGKSTELRRLAARLEDPQRVHLLTVIVDAEEMLDLTTTVDIPDIMSSILYQTERKLREKEGEDPDVVLSEGYLTRLWNWLVKTDIELQKAEYSIPGGPKLVGEMKTRPSLRARVRGIIAAHLSTFLNDVRNELVLFNERARILGYTGLAIIYDSLEKLRGISTNWHEVLGSAEKIFAGGAPYLQLPVHIIFTVPPALATRFGGVSYLPMIKLQTRVGRKFKPGYQVARDLICRRIPDDDLATLLGPQSEKRVRKMIGWSGGYPKELMRIVQSLLTLTSHPVSEKDIDRIGNEIHDAYRKMVPSAAFPWLAKVATEHYLTIENDEHRQVVDLMLTNNAVLRYLNQNDWFDLHPAVYRIPGVQEAIQARKTLTETGATG